MGIGLTFAGFPEVGIPLEEASVALGESDMLAEAGAAGTFLQNAGSYVVDTGKTMRNMAKPPRNVDFGDFSGKVRVLLAKRGTWL